MQRQINNSAVADRIFLPGHTRRMMEILQEAEIFALSSRSEGLPNILQEAMAAGCARAAFDCRFGPRDIIVPEEDGLLCLRMIRWRSLMRWTVSCRMRLCDTNGRSRRPEIPFLIR